MFVWINRFVLKVLLIYPINLINLITEIWKRLNFIFRLEITNQNPSPGDIKTKKDAYSRRLLRSAASSGNRAYSRRLIRSGANQSFNRRLLREPAIPVSMFQPMVWGEFFWSFKKISFFLVARSLPPLSGRATIFFAASLTFLGFQNSKENLMHNNLCIDSLMQYYLQDFLWLKYVLRNMEVIEVSCRRNTKFFYRTVWRSKT